MKELKGDLIADVQQSHHELVVESGEGIERSTIFTTPITVSALLWNPVKELKVHRLAEGLAKYGVTWNPVKELKVLFVSSIRSLLMEVESGEGIESGPGGEQGSAAAPGCGIR